MRKLLFVIATNRRLKYINLAWNGIVDNNASEKEQKEVIGFLT